jgi:hypothetical protein
MKRRRYKMRRANSVLLLCVIGIMACASWTFGQETTTPTQIPGVATTEKKPVVPSQEKWEFEITPYFWMAGLNGDVTIKGIPANISMSFSDIMSDFKFGGQMHMEARKGKWGLFLDATYMSLGTDINGTRKITGPDGIAHVQTYLDASINMDEWLVEFGGAYQLAKIPLGQNKGGMMMLDLLVGGRYWYLYTDIDVGLVLEDNANRVSRYFSGSGSKQWVDPFIGLRASFQLTDKLMLAFRGDVGGFSVGSKSSWNASGYFGYRVSEMVSLIAGYRALYVDYESGSGNSKFVWDVTMHGPAVGVTFRF